MNNFKEYLSSIENKNNRKKLEELLNKISEEFPNLETRIGWGVPMFIDHGTFIISFSVAKEHFSVGPEKEAYDKFYEDISKKYSIGKKLFRIKWEDEIDYELLKKMIMFTIEKKKDYKLFWSK